MTPKERAAIQQALEALEEYRDTQMIKAPRRAITALREAQAGDNMSPTEQTLIQQALEHKRSCAYKRIDQNPSECTCGVTEALTAMREALAGDNLSPTEQEEQEPVAWYSVKGGFNTCGEGKPLYAAPVRTKDLTDDEVMQTYTNFNLNELGEQSFMIGFARAVIAADREKNK